MIIHHLPRPGRVLRRVPWLLATGLLLGLAVSQVIAHAIPFQPTDASSYTWAGQAWRDTGNPYAAAPEIVEDNPIYRYSPWFAVPWIALSLLPHDLVERAWALAMVACAFVAVVPVFRAFGARAIPLGGFMLGWLVAIGLLGNVQPAMVALLTWGVERRWGPIAIAVCASLKAVPLLYALVYAGRGEWGKVAIALGLTGVLSAPMLLFDIPELSVSAGASYSLFSTSVGLWAVVTLAAVVAAWTMARTRYAWLGAGTAAALALPKAFLYDVTLLLPGASISRPSDRSTPGFEPGAATPRTTAVKG